MHLHIIVIKSWILLSMSTIFSLRIAVYIYNLRLGNSPRKRRRILKTISHKMMPMTEIVLIINQYTNLKKAPSYRVANGLNRRRIPSTIFRKITRMNNQGFMGKKLQKKICLLATRWRGSKSWLGVFMMNWPLFLPAIAHVRLLFESFKAGEWF